MTDGIFILISLMNIGVTLINLAVLGLGVKLYTDHRKQILLGRKDHD